MKLVSLMSSPFGRGLRILLGLVVIAAGLLIVGGTWGTVIAIVGIVPVMAGEFNFCLLGPILGQPFRGRPHLPEPVPRAG